MGLHYVISVSLTEPQAAGSSGLVLCFGGAPGFSRCLYLPQVSSVLSACSIEGSSHPAARSALPL